MPALLRPPQTHHAAAHAGLQGLPVQPVQQDGGEHALCAGHGMVWRASWRIGAICLSACSRVTGPDDFKWRSNIAFAVPYKSFDPGGVTEVGQRHQQPKRHQ